ncbi:hypothetical protein Scep_019918 [Stephania cephalantha]|uniref:Uncharacterized protein n=1 Tax=Stephania cephalantha TaxID=152367 RepID=A0AAP0IBK2_9MAGN
MPLFKQFVLRFCFCAFVAVATIFHLRLHVFHKKSISICGFGAVAEIISNN